MSDMKNIPEFILSLSSYWVFLTYPATGVIFIGGILLICVGLTGMFWLATKIITGIHEKLKSRPKKEKVVREPGLLASYLKARKEKVCPIIKFEE